MEQEKKQEKTSRLAAEILQLARDSVLVQLRFLDVALSRLRPAERAGINAVATDGASFFYDPVYVLRRYRDEPGYGARIYLHVLLHCIFYHSFQYGRLEEGLWDLAADIAVENTILEMGLNFAKMQTDVDAQAYLQRLKTEIGALTAERIYHYFKQNPPDEDELEEMRWLFVRDSHELWKPAQEEELVITQEMWKKISERVKADLKSFSKGKTNSESLEKNLAEATRDRYDYAKLLERFTVMGEDVQVNEDEFDYIYYTYGLSRYGNMPLIEPLEYRDAKKVKEFVIALDTSASCRGSVLQGFLRKTYSVLKGTEHFFQKINVHIIQCDSEIRSDVKITCEEDFDAFLKNEKLQGFGSTDFRPVFEYVDNLLAEGEFENLKGLIYFTDGYGVYPQRMPDYDVIFAFLQDDDQLKAVPPWAIKVILNEDELEENEGPA
ncbi:MAG: VWA-like domain-containing protein [Eubacteriales bacterium]|nr:VWA-like domain-containing protein [Eubacteriales bacterium]